MKFPSPLIRGQLLRRYKRFLADVVLDNGEEITAHVANPGGMLGLAEPGSQVWLRHHDDPKRKLAYSWELVRVGEALVCVNTGHPNRLVAGAIADGLIPELAGYDNIRREVKYGERSRIDLLLEADGRPPCYVEIKSVTLARGDGPPFLAEFPDAITARGAKHLEELARMAESGHRAVMFYLVQRSDCDRFALAADIDPRYAEAFIDARERGVEAICYDCRLGVDGIDIARRLPISAPL